MKGLSFWGEKTVISTRFRSVFAAAMFSMAIAYVLLLTDNVAAGQLVGEDAVLAMTLVFPLLSFILFLGYLITDGLVMLLSYANGHGDRERVNQLFSMGVILAAVTGTVFVVGMYLFRDNLLAFWDISPHLLDYARDYYDGLQFYAPLMLFNVFFYTVFVAEGQERICVFCAMCTFVVNVVLDIVLSLQIGVMGVGIATSCGLLAAVCVQLYFICSGHTRVHFRWYWQTREVLGAVGYSFYHALDTLLFAMLPAILSSCIISNFGEEHIIVVTVAINLLTLIIALYLGMVDCMQAMVCQYHAEENLHSLQKAMALTIRITVYISLIVTTLGMAAAEFLPVVFGVNDEGMVSEAAVAVRCFLLFTVFLGCSLMYSNYYIYTERRNYGAVLKTLLFLIGPWIGMELGASYSLNGMWLGTGAGFALAYIFNWWWTRKTGFLCLDKEKLSRQYSYDINCTAEEVVSLSQMVAQKLQKRGVPSKHCNIIAVLVEEIGMHACERSAGTPFQLEYSFLLGESADAPITMIVRDNGKPYDIIRAAEERKYSFREYFIEAMTAPYARGRYWISGDENRLTLRIGAAR